MLPTSIWKTEMMMFSFSRDLLFNSPTNWISIEMLKKRCTSEELLPELGETLVVHGKALFLDLLVEELVEAELAVVK